jgi:ABC-2 type transport system permease protein
MNWWRSIISQEIKKILSYRSDFWVTFVGQTLIQLLIARALWVSVFEAQDVASMKGFDLETMTLYYLIAPVGTRILLGESFGFISREIYDGTFTKYLLYPLSFVQYKTLTYLTNSLFYALQLIMIVLAYRFFIMSAPFQPSFFLDLLAGTTLFFLAAIVYLSLGMAIELISLWADNVWSLMVMLRFFTAFLGGGFIPMSFYPEWALKIMLLTPFPYLVSLPIRTIMGQASGGEVFNGILIMCFWWVMFRSCVHLLWNYGQKRYTGVGQ